MREYTVLIVDDEAIVREDLKELIDWESQGFRIVAEASNGRAGVEQFLRHQPDIVFSDIRMPVLDGFGMIEEIRRLGKSCEFILLTGYGDFEYARKALQLDLHSYLLKHELNRESLLQVLDKSRSILEADRKHKTALQGNLFRAVLSRRIRPQELEEIRDSGLLEVRSGSSCLLLIDSGAPGLEDALELAVKALGQMSLYSVIEFDCRVAVLKTPAEGARQFFQLGQRLAAELYRAVGETGQELKLILSRRTSDLSSLADVYDEARSFRAYYPLISRKGGIILVEEWQVSPIPAEEVKESLLQLKGLLEENRHMDFGEKAEEFLRQCVRCRDPKAYALWKERLTGELERQNQARHYSAEELIGGLRRAPDAESASYFLQQIALKFDSMSAEAGTNKMRRILQYIDQNYEKDLGLRDIAQLLSVNEIYAGQLFKKEMGITFKKYLTQVRIQKAIELLESGEYKIYEVSEMVGYQTLQYFSAKFKQVTGKNPSDYL